MKFRSILFAAATLAAAAPATVQAQPLWGSNISSSSEPLTPAELASFLGAPDDLFTGLGAGWVTYDFGPFALVDGVGQDFNIYEYNSGQVEFNLVDILVSANGVDWHNVEATFAGAVDLVGDEAHTAPSFRRSFDVGGAVTALGATQFRYLRIDGTGSGAIGSSTAFDLDSVAAINYVNTAAAVPEPGTWAMMIGGFGLMGGMMRRRKTQDGLARTAIA